MSAEFSVVTPEEIEPESFDTVDIAHRKYTEALGCMEMRVNYLTLKPGEKLTPHTHERQEELFVPLTGGKSRSKARFMRSPRAGSYASVPTRSEAW
jgi:uncharacterized cupin superfamily protein